MWLLCVCCRFPYKYPNSRFYVCLFVPNAFLLLLDLDWGRHAGRRRSGQDKIGATVVVEHEAISDGPDGAAAGPCPDASKSSTV